MSTPKAKSTNGNTNKRSYINHGSWSDYRNLKTGEIILVNRQSINEELASKLYEECRKEDFYSIEQFYVKMGIPERTYFRWIKDPENQHLADMHDYAKLCAGLNRQKIALDRNLSLGSTAAWLLPHLMPESYGKHLT